MKLFSVLMTALIALLTVSSAAYAVELTFESVQVGGQEVPQVSTRTTGKTRLAFAEGLTSAGYRLDIRRGVGITQAHLHCGRAGLNGPVVAFLFGLEPEGVDVNGTLARGVLTNNDIIPVSPEDDSGCDVTINNIASLFDAIRAGYIYVNVHSLANPPGEVRGQVFP